MCCPVSELWRQFRLTSWAQFLPLHILLAARPYTDRCLSFYIPSIQLHLPQVVLSQSVETPQRWSREVDDPQSYSLSVSLDSEYHTFLKICFHFQFFDFFFFFFSFSLRPQHVNNIWKVKIWLKGAFYWVCLIVDSVVQLCAYNRLRTVSRIVRYQKFWSAKMYIRYSSSIIKTSKTVAGYSISWATSLTNTHQHPHISGSSSSFGTHCRSNRNSTHHLSEECASTPIYHQMRDWWEQTELWPAIGPKEPQGGSISAGPTGRYFSA